jgi:hypothetical protein
MLPSFHSSSPSHKPSDYNVERLLVTAVKSKAKQQLKSHSTQAVRGYTVPVTYHSAPTAARKLIVKFNSYLKQNEGNIALALIFILVMAILGLILLSIVLAPVMSSVITLCILLSLLFVVTESHSIGIWHHNREAENRFWCLIAAALMTAIVFSPDSPLNIGYHIPSLGISAVVATALYINHRDRELVRYSLMRPPHLQRVSSLNLIEPISTKNKLQQLIQAMEQLDFKFAGTKVINGRQITAQEELIVNTFSLASTEELNYFVSNINLSLLFYKIKDSDVVVFGANNLIAQFDDLIFSFSY